MASATVGATIALAVLIATFNVVLDAHLRADADNVLRERVSTVLRALGTLDGHLSVLEAPDRGAIDAQTWIFAGRHALEQPAQVDPRNQRAVLQLARAGQGFTTVDATDTRLLAAPIRASTERLGTVVVGASLAPYESTASSTLLGSVILGLVILAAIAALSLWLVTHALHPVARMTAQAADWGEHDLSRRFFAGRPHDELSTLASVFDGLLARLAGSFRRERNLTAEISHELRTPLAKILAEAELASARERTPEQYRASLQLVTRYANDLLGVLETLLASARASGSDVAHSSDARALAERALTALKERVAMPGKTLELACEHTLRVAVEGDVVERILAPLLENAARYARARVLVRIEAANGEVLFEIRDDGPGIAPGERERIFEPGFRGGLAGYEDHAGAGLGLSLVRRLARAAGGEVEARESGTGAIFVVRLPAR
jgi:signal transduction histidine kinase